MPIIRLPHNGWKARKYQIPLWKYLRDGGKRAIAVWHRRAGKDDVALHFAACEAQKRAQNIWHTLPEYSQGRKALWQAVNPHTGRRRIDEAFPEELRDSTNDTEMFIRFKPVGDNDAGSTWQIIGSDQYDRTVGSSPGCIIYSEWALANPSAWAYHRPMLQENNGTALFITTPRGRNHALDLLKYAKATPHWFSQVLTAKETGAISTEALEEALKEYTAIYGEDVGRAQFEQEYNCSFTASILGSFYALEMAAVRAEGRIAEIEPLAGQSVHRAWDLGIGDDTSVWKFQIVGSQVFVLSHKATSGVSVEWWRDELAAEDAKRGWKTGTDWVPHDAKHREFGTGRTIIETMRALNLRPMPVPSVPVQDGINAVRRTLPLCVFHPRCEEGGISALEQYRREWDDEKKAFRASALHDWASHPADAFRYLALSWRQAPARVIATPKPTGIVIPPPRDVRQSMRF